MLIFSVYFFLLYLPRSNSTISMITIWGEPNNYVNVCNNTGTSSNFTVCFSSCYYQSDCIIAYMNQSNICYLCGFNKVETVNQKTYEDNMKVAMKININDTICQSEYPVEGQIDYGYLPPNGDIVPSYEINYQNPVWTIEYSQPSCPSGWKMFSRQKGAWCMNVFYSTTVYYNWSNADIQCQLYNATLSGIETAIEYNYINSTINALWQSGTGYLWLGAVRRAECYANQYNVTLCSNKSAVFFWTDNFTSGVEGFNYWGAGLPNGVISASGEEQACLTMWVGMDPGATPGSLDDQYCSATAYTAVSPPTYCQLAYVCGKQPQ